MALFPVKKVATAIDNVMLSKVLTQPDYTKCVVLLNSPIGSGWSFRYTPPSNGWIWGKFNRTGDGGTNIKITIDGITYNWNNPRAYWSNHQHSSIMPVAKGSIIDIVANDNCGGERKITFIPCKAITL